MKTPHRTAIARTKPSLPARTLDRAGLLIPPILDYGAGRGFDARFYGATPYDPHYFPEYPTRRFRTVMSNYVLNVVPPETQKRIIFDALSLLTPNGTAYFTVRRDIPKEGTKTQRWATIPGATKLLENRTLCIYELRKP